jgi:predicted DNA-binding transcriptional regulator AlpA
MNLPIPKNVSPDVARHESRDFPNRLLSVPEAARSLGLSASTLNKLRLSGDGPLYMKLGRRVLYDLRDLEAWARERKRSHTSESPLKTSPKKAFR